MFCDHNPNLESRNFIDGLIFTRDDPCVWVVYPPGAAGDLLVSIIDRHYIRTGCEYYGINDRGRVMLYTTDYKMIQNEMEKNQSINFDQQWFYDFSNQLGNRNLTYSMLDQVIVSCHMCRPKDVQHILKNFSQAMIINIYAQDSMGDFIIKNMTKFKNRMENPDEIMTEDLTTPFQPNIIQHERVLNVPFGFLFNQNSYAWYYAEIRKFLKLSGPLICFEYMEFYLSKQNNNLRTQLEKYSQIFDANFATPMRSDRG